MDGILSNFSQAAMISGLPTSLIMTAAGISSAVGTAIQRWNFRNHLLKTFVKCGYLLLFVDLFLGFQVQVDFPGRAGATWGFDAVNYSAHAVYAFGKLFCSGALVERVYTPRQMDDAV